MIQKLRDYGNHPNIVSFLSHGWLIEEQVYHIDMGLCLFSLRDFLDDDVKSKLPSPFLEHRDDIKGPKCLYFWSIVRDISQGLLFIHGEGELHRDIKPENGKPQKSSRNIGYIR